MKCKREDCQHEAPPGMWYHSRDCAPFGRLGGGRDTKSEATEKSISKEPGEDLDRSRPFGRKGMIVTVPRKPRNVSEKKNEKNKGGTMQTTPTNTDKGNDSGGMIEGRVTATGEIITDLSVLTPQTLHEQSVERSIIFGTEVPQPSSMNLIDESAKLLIELMGDIKAEIQKSNAINPALVTSAANCAAQVQKLLRLKFDLVKG